MIGFLYAYVLVELFVWVRRAVLMLGSIRRYSLIPILSWQKIAGQAPLVSMIIPCRNEERNLPTLLPSLIAQSYPALEFIFIDDRSTDQTLQILKSFASQDSRIRVLEGKPLPPGWTGKNHAMHQCAEVARGEWLLFTDADTCHEPHSVSSSVRYAQGRGLDILTLSAKCVCKSFGEHLVQPMGIGCFSVWFKLDEVNAVDSRTPLACGQYFMIKKSVFEAVGGQASVKAEVTEDLELFKRVKERGFRCEVGIGSHIFATRMYRSWREAWIGWRRIYLHGLQKNIPSIFSKILMLIFNSFLPFVITPWIWVEYLRTPPGAPLGLALLWTGLCGFILFMRSRSHATLKTSQWSILLHPLSALVIVGIMTDCLRHHFMGRKVEWKQERY